MARGEIKDSSYQIPFGSSSEVELHVQEVGEGQPFLLLHGGAGPVAVTGFAKLLAQRHNVRVLIPFHPGFVRTPRPVELNNMKQLAELYSNLLDELGLTNVRVIGNSMGGWIGSEMAILGAHELNRLVLVDAVGIEVPGHPVADVFKLTPDEIMRLSYHDPAPYRIDVTKMTEDQRAVVAANRAALKVYGGDNSIDASLAGRLGSIRIPTLVIWGESDRIVDPEYGRAFAASIPGAKFIILERAGHVPQIETPDKLLDTIWNFAGT